MPLFAGTTPRRTFFFTMKDLVYTAFPICAPTPAPTALTIKIAPRPATVTVVTPSTTVKTARPQGANNRPTLFCADAMCAALSAVALVNVSPVLTDLKLAGRRPATKECTHVCH